MERMKASGPHEMDGSEGGGAGRGLSGFFLVGGFGGENEKENENENEQGGDFL
jgi:hypothetical protein